MPTEYATDGPEQEVSSKRSDASKRRIKNQGHGNVPTTRSRPAPAIGASTQGSAIARNALVKLLARAIAQDLGS